MTDDKHDISNHPRAQRLREAAAKAFAEPAGAEQTKQPTTFFHATPNLDLCKHNFQGWREIDGGRGGEQVCTKCGIGAMEYSLRTGP